MDRLALDIAHMFAGGLVLVSFMLLYQDRMFSLINVFALHALVVSLSVAWQAHIQNAPHLYITAVIALVVKALVIPVVLHRMIVRLGIHRNIETVVGIGFSSRLSLRKRNAPKISPALVWKEFVKATSPRRPQREVLTHKKVQRSGKERTFRACRSRPSPDCRFATVPFAPSRE